MVGFEESAYSIDEGESLEICVAIFSPDDIESTRVFLEVVLDEDAAENTASKPVRVSHNEVIVYVDSLTNPKELTSEDFCIIICSWFDI